MIRCRDCNTSNVIKHGFWRGKQRYKCLNSRCRLKFVKTDEQINKEMEAIGTALDLYFQGLSLRKIKRHISTNYEYDAGITTIWRWIIKYGEEAKWFLDRFFKPNLFSTWAVDEIFLVWEGKNHYCWDVLDINTRFLIANRVSARRSLENATQLFTDCRIRAGYPKVILSDGWPGYGSAIRKAFRQINNRYYGEANNIPKVTHVPSVSISDKAINNNVVERFNGTIRERYKVMRGFKSIATSNAIMNAFYVDYNYVRPHQGLGMTPAEYAWMYNGGIGVEVDLGNQWKNILLLMHYGWRYASYWKNWHVAG